ncbi:MAG: M20/M25/M40 family metallo-hydrolase, partial [Methanobacteriaceae archaeon]|nr:M20/M25/M40 family metallo-hydrolase [Methanobacteriaceae archaeon]
LNNNLSFNATISVRSAFDSERDNLNDEVKSIAECYDGIVEIRGAYPSWEYNKESKLRDLICKIYEKEYNKPMTVEIIHAGLECGLFVNKIDGLDAVSMGPTLKDVHSYNEKMSISSVYRTYGFLLKILKELKYS